MSGEVFGCAVNDNVRPEQKRPLEDRGQKCVIHGKKRAVLMGNLRKSRKVGHFHHGIGRRFGIDHARVGAHGGTHGVRIADIDRVKSYPEVFPKLFGLTVGAAVNIIG